MEMKVKLKPFQVPNFILCEPTPSSRQEGMKEGLKFALSEVDVETLEMLCEKFREDVFARAGKSDPRNIE